LKPPEVFDGSHVFHVAAGTVLIVLAAASMILRAVLYRKEHPEHPNGRRREVMNGSQCCADLTPGSDGFSDRSGPWI
jgi:hypothetical protein